MKPIPTPDQLTDAAANVFDSIVRGGLADPRRTPAATIEEAPQCTVYRYLVADEAACRALPGGNSLAINSIAMVASPFDFARARLLAPMRPVANVTNGFVLSVLYRALGGAPAPLVKRGFQLSSLDKYLTKPMAVLSHLDDRDFLSQIEAVDRFVANMHAYPGRTFGQLYHRFFRVNDLADGVLELSHRTIALADVRVPVLSVAGTSDTLAPRPAVHAVGDLLPI